MKQRLGQEYFYQIRRHDWGDSGVPKTETYLTMMKVPTAIGFRKMWKLDLLRSDYEKAQSLPLNSNQEDLGENDELKQ